VIDAAAPVPDAQAAEDAGQISADAGTDAKAPADGATGLPSTCDASCQKLVLAVLVGPKTDTFARAQFGFNADGTLQVEAHKGGDAACPTQSSPTPDFTAVIANVPFPTSAAPVSSGVTVSFLDFKGDLTDKPVLKAKTVTLTPVAAPADAKGATFIAFDISAVLDNGQVDGHVYATHCPSMDEK
jgi:hypothetical protein